MNSQPIPDGPLLAVTKQIIRATVSIGIDEAGSRLLGSTAWNYMKRVIKPVYGQLENKYPREGRCNSLFRFVR